MNSAGGVLVPAEVLNAIIALRETYGVFRRECRVVPMSADALDVPRRTGGFTTGFFGENTALSKSQVSFDDVNLTAKKLGTLGRLSSEVSEDAIASFGDFVTAEVAYAFASKEDDCGFNGDGSSVFGGMRGLTVLATDAGRTPASIASPLGP